MPAYQPPPAGQEFEYVEEPMPQQGYRPGMMPYDGTIPLPGKDSEFLKWLFNFKKQVTTPLRYLWRGYEQTEDGIWRPPKYKGMAVMNEKGITWSISYIESYINPVFISSNYSERDLNWTMREAGRVVYNNLCCRYAEFGMNKLDINRIATEIITKLHAILLGALNNGYRKFFQTTHSTVESLYNEPQQKRGAASGIRGIFGGRGGQQQQEQG